MTRLRCRRPRACRAGAAAVVYHSPYPLHILILILIWSFAYTSWSMMGRFGLVSLGHGGFMGVGAYVTALLWNHLGVSPWIGIPLAMLAAGVLALVVAYPCFRFRIIGHYFALVTLAVGEVVRLWIIAERDWTGGSLGVSLKTAGTAIMAIVSAIVGRRLEPKYLSAARSYSSP
ncbi:MAG: branched-chain amino acid ABC transporter permease [Aquincola sp.]|nr:branched-chain amino acid ABC transporter permease [Aquincola sp.]